MRSRCRGPASQISPRQARVIAEAGVYDFSMHHDQILVPIVLQRWNVESLEGLTAEAAIARDSLVAYIAASGRPPRAPSGGTSAPPRRSRRCPDVQMPVIGRRSVAVQAFERHGRPSALSHNFSVDA